MLAESRLAPFAHQPPRPRNPGSRDDTTATLTDEMEKAERAGPGPIRQAIRCQSCFINL